jgi:hypothetical protein
MGKAKTQKQVCSFDFCAFWRPKFPLCSLRFRFGIPLAVYAGGGHLEIP